MMKKLVLCILFFCFAVFLYSQTEPFLLRIDGEDISRAEFEAAYWAHDFSTESVKEFLQLFIDRKLKIVEARSLKLDTTPEYIAAISVYEKKNDNYLLSMLQTDDSLWEQYCEQQRSLPQPGKVGIMQIFKAMPQNSTSSEQERTIRSMETLYTQLTMDTLAGFFDYVNRYSEDKRCFEVGWLETSPDFEQTVFSMREGEVSKPFVTPSGIHIVKVITKKRIPTDDDLNDSFRLRMMRRYKGDCDLTFLQYLKSELNYIPDTRHINELLIKGYTRGVLFTLDGKEYTDADFRSFVEENPKGIKRQFDDFVTKMLFDNLLARSDRKPLDSNSSLESTKEDLLIAEIIRREIIEKARDKAGLAAYFSVHKKEYRWEYPRFKGVVLHTQNKQQHRSAKKLVKKMPFEDWSPIITRYFNPDSLQQVEVEQGIFALGDNVFVDKLVFKSGHASPHPSFPLTFVIGKKIKGPESYGEALEAVLPDYERFLEKRWLQYLRDRYRVEINEEALKTVNNH